MARLNTRLTDIQYVPSSVGSVLTNLASSKLFIAAFILFNNDTVTRTVNLHNVPDNSGALGTASNANKFAEIVLADKETYLLEIDYPITLIDTNDSIQASASAASQITIQVLGDRDA